MSLEEIIRILRQSGYKITPQRVAVIKVVLESDEHLTPAAIYARGLRIEPRLGEVTVYRTLNILSRLSLVCTVHGTENAPGFVGRPAGHHGHLICSACGRVVNFTGGNIAGLEKRLAAETGFSIEDHRLDFYGKCPECIRRVGEVKAAGT